MLPGAPQVEEVRARTTVWQAAAGGLDAIQHATPSSLGRLYAQSFCRTDSSRATFARLRAHYRTTSCWLDRWEANGQDSRATIRPAGHPSQARWDAICSSLPSLAGIKETTPSDNSFRDTEKGSFQGAAAVQFVNSRFTPFLLGLSSGVRGCIPGQSQTAWLHLQTRDWCCSPLVQVV